MSFLNQTLIIPFWNSNGTHNVLSEKVPFLINEMNSLCVCVVYKLVLLI